MQNTSNCCKLISLSIKYRRLTKVKTFVSRIMVNKKSQPTADQPKAGKLVDKKSDVKTKKATLAPKKAVKAKTGKKPVSQKASRGKVDLISKYQSHKEDTGSIEVQVAVITKKIADLTKHLKGHKKDYDSRRGLLSMVGKRRRLLNYLKKSDEAKYEKLIKDLGLRK